MQKYSIFIEHLQDSVYEKQKNKIILRIKCQLPKYFSIVSVLCFPFLTSSPSYLGTWQITSSTFGAYSAMSEEDCSALVGTRFEYFKDYAIYDDQHRLDSPKYIESILTADDFSSIYQGTSLETLGISKDSIQVVAIENAGGIGDTFYIKDENTLIIPWDGVFFEVQRVSSDS